MSVETWAIEDTLPALYDPKGGDSGENNSIDDADAIVISDLPQTVDDHEGIDAEDLEDTLREVNDMLSDDDKEDIKDIIEKHFQDESNAPEPENTEQTKDSSVGGKEAGKNAGNIWTFADVDARKVKKKKKWETVIQRWARLAIKDQFRDVEQWARINRRFAIMGNGNLLLPTEMEQDDMFWDENQIEVWFFQDTSGSCAHFKDRFFMAAASLPEDKFKIRMFCFDTRVYETTLESKKLYGFGGTAFGPLEAKIQQLIKQEKIEYPKAVFVVTDGYGTAVNPEHPERWYWFLSDNCQHYIPKQSQRFMLKDFE